MAKKKKSFKSFFTDLIHKDGTHSLLSSVICILIGLLVGFVVMIIITMIAESGNTHGFFKLLTVAFNKSVKGLGIIVKGPLSSKKAANRITNTGNMIFYAVPLIFTGLSVAIAYKTGLFNIGAPGQYVMGIIGSMFVALNITATSTVGHILVWILALLAGALCGALWGLIPGILKAFFNINEVIVCIMTNWIAANLSSWIFSNMKTMQSTENTKGGYLKKVIENATPKLGFDKLFPRSMLDMGIVIAAIVAVVIYIVLNKTTFGYELKACGSNKDASKYAGLNEKRNIILSICIAGALAGLGASLYYLNPGIEYKYISAYSKLPDYGFNGIASAFLANCNPIGVVFSSVLIRFLSEGGNNLPSIGFNRYVADVVVAVIIYMAGFSRIIKEWLNNKNAPNKLKKVTLKRKGGAK